MKYLKNVLSGAVIGIAEIIPGVSGGTLAVLMGIYDELIQAISHFRKDVKQNLKLLIPLLLGMGASLIAFSHVIKFLLANYPMAVNFLFLGLILGIIPMLFKRSTEGGFKIKNAAPFLVTFAIMIVLAIVSASSTEEVTIVRDLTAGMFFKFMAVGFLAAVCLILPGISGSMIMVIFGIYDSVINAVTEFNVLLLLPVGLGILLGLLFGSKGIDYCLRKFPQATYFAILGLVAGSTVSLYNRSGFVLFSGQGAIAVVMLLLGIGISLFFTADRFQKKAL